MINRSYRRNVGWTNEYHLVRGERISLEELKSIINGGKDPIIVAFSDSILDTQGEPLVLGCISAEASHCHPSLELPENSALIGLFAVDEKYQSKGIGSRLLQEIFLHVKKCWGFKIAVLWVIEQRKDIQIWYERLGFQWTGEMKEFAFPTKLIDADTKFRVYKKLI